MKLRHIALAIATAGLLSVGAAQAQPSHEGWHHDGMEFLHGLNLTDLQKTQIHKIMASNWSQMKPVMEQMHTIHEQIITKLITPGAVTESDLSPLVQQEEQLRTQTDAARVNVALQVRALLTPGQLAKAASTHQQLEALHEQERAVMGGPDAP